MAVSLFMKKKTLNPNRFIYYHTVPVQFIHFLKTQGHQNILMKPNSENVYCISVSSGYNQTGNFSLEFLVFWETVFDHAIVLSFGKVNNH